MKPSVIPSDSSVIPSKVEGSRYASLKLAARDPSTLLGMTGLEVYQNASDR